MERRVFVNQQARNNLRIEFNHNAIEVFVSGYLTPKKTAHNSCE